MAVANATQRLGAAAAAWVHADADTLAISGVLTFATAAAALAAGARLVGESVPVRLDLAAVTRADSAGLACVIALAACVQRHDGALQVVNWPPGLRALAEVCDVAALLDGPAQLA